MYAPSHRRLVLLQRLSPRRNLEHDSWQGSGEGLVPLGQPVAQAAGHLRGTGRTLSIVAIGTSGIEHLEAKLLPLRRSNAKMGGDVAQRCALRGLLDELDPLVGVHGQLVLKKALTSSCVRSARVRPRSKSTPVKFLEA